MRVVGIQAAFVKADNGFAFANRIFDGKCEPHAFEPAARDVWVRRKRRPHTPRRDGRAEGGRRESRKRFCDFAPAISFVSRLCFAAPLTVQRKHSDNSLACA